MHLDVQTLRDFYYRNALGRAAQKVIRTELTRFWPEAARQTVAGYGFAVPLLRPYLKTARRVIGLMPGPQGVMPWPQGMPNVSVLCEEMLWPLETGHVDKLVLMHGLETCDSPMELLDECYRVLGPGGGWCSCCPIGPGFGRGRTGRLSAMAGPIPWASLRRS